MTPGGMAFRSARHRRFWWVAALLLTLGAGGFTTYLVVTQTAGGRAWLVTKAVDAANGVFDGRGALRVGVLRELGPRRIVAEQVALVDTAGVPVVAVERLEVSLSWGDLAHKAVLLKDVHLDGVAMDLRQDAPGVAWNIAHIIAGDTTTSTPGATPGFGDDVRIDALTISRAQITTVAPWEPHPVFTGAARDSVIAVRDSLHDLTPASGGRWFERRVIALDRVKARDIVVVDAQQRPASLQLDSLRGTISDPPVPVRQAEGRITWTSDSLTLNLTHVALPASVGSAVGTVAWYQPGAVRFDVQVKADAGLSDLTWVWDVLPQEGRGKADVRMRTLEDPDDMEFALGSLDVQSGGSRVQGGVAITVRPADLLLHKVELAFTPLRSELLRRISYGALPPAIRGRMTGQLVAGVGGPLSAFRIDRLDARFFDEGLSGPGLDAPVSSLTLHGTVGLGAKPSASDMTVSALRVDLRSVRPLLSDAPPVDGILSGALTIRAADMTRAELPDVALVWTDSENHVSSLRGEMSVRHDRDDWEFNTRLALEPIAMRALARIDTTIGLQSRVAGYVSAHGRLSSLEWRGDLAALADGDSVPMLGDPREEISGGLGNAWPSAVSLAGTASIGKKTWQATAAGSLTAFDVRRWFGRSDMPTTALSGQIRLAAQGKLDTVQVSSSSDTAAARALTGEVVVNLRQAQRDDHPALDLNASLALDAQRFRVDSALAHFGGLTLEARGSLGRDTGQSDTLEVSARSDSLDAARPELTRLATMLQPLDSASAGTLRTLAADTLQGDLSLSGYLIGSLHDADAIMALGGRALQVGAIRVGRLFGSARAEHVFTRPTFEGTATMDEVTGVGAVRIQNVTTRVTDASPDSGRLVLDVGTETDAQLVARGSYRLDSASTTIALDSLRLSYDEVVWHSQQPIEMAVDSAGARLQPVEMRSSIGGVLAVAADIPTRGRVQGQVRLENFPVGEVATLLTGARLIEGTLSGRGELAGTREAPELSWQVTGDSLGVSGYRLPAIVSHGAYADQRLVVNAVLEDSLGGALRAEGRIPIDLRFASVEKRLLSETVEGALIADSLRVEALPVRVEGISRPRGVLTGRLSLGGTFEHPAATGTMVLDGAGASFTDLGITPSEGRVVVRASADSVILESLRLRSGRSAGDTLSARGVLLLPTNAPAAVDLQFSANSFEVSHQRDGTDLEIGGAVRVQGPLSRPTVSGGLMVPRANIVVDPLGERVALDLSSKAARELLGAEEVPVAESAAQSFSALGSIIAVENARVSLGEDVWVQTPEARVKLGGGLSVAMNAEQLVLDGAITANRGQYRLELGPVFRGFTIDSGSVRFYPNPELSPTLDINATNTVRVTGGGEVPIKLHIGGNYEQPALTLSSTDPLYSSAPESEIISLLIFGAPTFALDGQSQSTVQAVTGLLLPSVGGAVEGALQRILPGNFNTVQVSTTGNESQASLSPTSLFDNLNLSISAGKQIGDRTYLRLNTGMCRGSSQVTRGAEFWYGIAVEFRLTPSWLGQLGVDPGSAPCTRVGGADFPRLQFGFDLFRNWIF